MHTFWIHFHFQVYIIIWIKSLIWFHSTFTHICIYTFHLDVIATVLSSTDKHEAKLKGVIYFQAIEEVYYDHLKNAHKVCVYMYVVTKLMHANNSCLKSTIYYLFNVISSFIKWFSPLPFLLFPSSVLVSSFSVSSLLSSSPSEPKSLPDLQCKDSRQSLLHGGSVSWGHEDLDGCDRHRCWGIHPVHGVVTVRDVPTCCYSLRLCRLRLDLFKCLDGYYRHLCWRMNSLCL